jgi:hypothetical protein
MNPDKQRLRRLLEQPRWKRMLFVLVLDLLLFWQHAIDYFWYLNFNFLFARRAFVKRYLMIVQTDVEEAYRGASPVDNWRL